MRSPASEVSADINPAGQDHFLLAPATADAAAVAIASRASNGRVFVTAFSLMQLRVQMDLRQFGSFIDLISTDMDPSGLRGCSQAHTMGFKTPGRISISANSSIGPT